MNAPSTLAMGRAAVASRAWANAATNGCNWRSLAGDAYSPLRGVMSPGGLVGGLAIAWSGNAGAAAFVAVVFDGARELVAAHDAGVGRRLPTSRANLGEELRVPLLHLRGVVGIVERQVVRARDALRGELHSLLLPLRGAARRRHAALGRAAVLVGLGRVPLVHEAAGAPVSVPPQHDLAVELPRRDGVLDGADEGRGEVGVPAVRRDRQVDADGVRQRLFADRLQVGDELCDG